MDSSASCAQPIPPAPKQIYRDNGNIVRVNLIPPQANTFWLVVASRPTQEEAVDLARAYSATIGPIFVVQSQNGLYAIVAGTLNFDKAKPNLITLKDLHIIPQDSFLSHGENLDRIVWLGFDRGTPLDFMSQSAYRGVVQRLQAAMTRLSLYRGPVDGLIGRTTVNAFNAYAAKFGMPNTDVITMDALAQIERTASDGFRNDPERSLAQSQGFSDALSFNEARAGGFASANIFIQAKNMGFRTQREFDVATSAGFASKADFQKAQTTGFTSAQDFRTAQKLGFATQRELAAFQSSGFSDPDEYRAAMQKGFADKASYDKAESKRLKVAKDAAVIVLSDAQTFLRLNPQLPNLIDIADKASALNAQLQTTSTDALATSTGQLNSLLLAVNGYGDFLATREKERTDAIEKQREQIHTELTAGQQALKKWMAGHLTSPSLPAVVAEVKDLDAVSASTDLDTLLEAQKGLRALIANQGLSKDLTQLAAETASTAPTTRAVSAPRIEETELNRVILKGALEDVVVLYNAGPTAPSLLRTLSGDFSFTTNEASVCVLGVEVNPSLERALRHAVSPLGGKTLHVKAGCAVEDIDRSDLFLLQRKKFIEANADYIVIYLDALEKKKLRPFEPFKFADLKAAIDQDSARVAQIANDVEAGTRPGFAGLILSNSSFGVCIVADGDLRVHQPAIDEIVQSIPISAPRQRTTAVDEAYAALRRDQCRVLYGSDQTLKKIGEALSRDGISFSYAPVWFDQPRLAAEQTKLDAEKQSQLKTAEAARLAAEEAKKLSEMKLAEDQKSKAAQELQLRQQNGPAASGLSNLLSYGLRKSVLNENGNQPTGPSIDIASSFPKFAAWNAGLEHDAWKPTDVIVTTKDYGSANWKGRNLQAIIVQADVKMKSAERGEYKDACFIFGTVIDTEFQMVRDPYEAPCSDDTSAAWLTGHDFRSSWVAR
ncbi:peptidoglycan-binding protein [Labrys sp. La1]|uniref:peptidoglycan-binding domain-containing protein n=1 Tax=Labrys sp. La1 TaxID=3404917 RepID=UPI003EBE49C9